ncbi:hypothetical protein G4O51_12835, partial [Candidatus Bathyarchaeota archaeon A05DMB-2]|nr:hypothetical protein [Candidatus Bathyarchaeota archaeon A05DMB-2]
MSVAIIAVQGYNPEYEINANYGSAPNVDGVIALGEWDDASTVSFNNTVVYVKQDGRNLYVAFNVSDATVTPSPPQDIVAIFIDVENNGGTSPQPDDILFGVSRSGILMEGQGDNPPGSPTGGWNASASSTNSHWQAEFNITYAKIAITPGEAKTLGIAFESWNYEETSYPYFWPPMTPMESNSPSNWGNLISEENWIPEFPSAIILPLFMIFSMLAVVF